MKTLIYTFILAFMLSCSDKSEEAKSPGGDAAPNNQDSKGISYINLSEEQAKELNIEIFNTESKAVDLIVSCPGDVSPAPDRSSIISAPISGIVNQIKAHEGEYVTKGQLLMVIESLDFINMVSEYMQAKQEVEYLAIELSRLAKLRESNISSKSDYDKMKNSYWKAGNDLQISRSKLKSIGLSDKETSDLECKFLESVDDLKKINGDKCETNLKIRAPISGYIDMHYVDLGQAVTTYDRMMTIIGTDKVLIRGYLSPGDAELVDPGDKVTITTSKETNRSIETVVHTKNPSLDPSNKAVTLNIYANTKSNWPYPGQNVRLEVLTKTKAEMVYVPVSAIAYFGETPIVFVKAGEGKFEKREIKLGRISESIAIVLEGLKAGEEVAVSEIFTLKSLAKFEEFAEE